ncbi:hypothetical protein, partial [Steroidobacter sp.]|uniref:hypothetical protein n=1 Tax=Steroidobacter sp. TaxID=1978227 RepID=UPI001A4A2108
MTDKDRSYSYLARTFDAPTLSTQEFARHLDAVAMPTWRRLHEAGVLASVETLRKVGDIDMQTAPGPVRDWGYFVQLELGAGADIEAVLQAERDAGLEAALARQPGIQYLSCEVLVRPAGAGTAIPHPSPRHRSPPANQYAGIEYIQIPNPHWDEYRGFMRDVMGPVGAQLVDEGYSYRIQIMERARLLRWDDSLPEWNRVHILWGEFDDPDRGFLRHTSEVIRSRFGPGGDVLSTLSRTSHYRVKPRMSKNVRL